MTEHRSGSNGTIMYLTKGVALLLENEVDCVFVLLKSPQPEDAKGGPEVLVDVEEPPINEARLELVWGTWGDEESSCWDEN